MKDKSRRFIAGVLSSLLYFPLTSDAFGHITFTKSVPSTKRKTSLIAKHLSDQEAQLLFGDYEEEEEEEEEKKTIHSNLIQPTKTSISSLVNHDVHSQGSFTISDNLPSSTLDYSTSNPLINQLYSMRKTVQSCTELWRYLANYYPTGRAIYDAHSCDHLVELTFDKMNQYVLSSASIFHSFGIAKGKNVAIFGENSAYWLLCDQGIQIAGGASAVRGADASPDELRYIYNHSDSAGIVILQGPKLLQRLIQDAKKKGVSDIAPLGFENQKYGPLRHILLMHQEKKSMQDIHAMIQSIKGANGLNVQIHSFTQLLHKALDQRVFESVPIVPIAKDDLSTIVYTSGTTGKPKGVMLSHGNLLHQIGHRLSPFTKYDDAEPLPGELMLALLPVWHITERTFELWMISRGCCITYSSIRTFKEDLAKHKPQWLVLVPRVLEKIAVGVQDKFSSGGKLVKLLVQLFTVVGKARAANLKISKKLVVSNTAPNILQIYRGQILSSLLSPLHWVGNKLVWRKIQDGFGGRVKVIICGGSALASSLETFYEVCGVPICVGYGLTECSPLLTHRRKDRNLVSGGCVGQPCIDTEIRIVDPEIDPNTINQERSSLPHGQVGLIIGRGPQITKGYYNNNDATVKAIDRFGFFDTGDLGKINPVTGDLVITGRCKDTIVLSNGENIEPSPIEDAIIGQIPMIQQVILTGQDGRSLIAIAVLNIMELTDAGYLDVKLGKMFQKDFDRVNDPKCTEDDCIRGCSSLNDGSKSLRNNSALLEFLMDQIGKATAAFRKWEQVGSVYITLEPFSMCNGLLTQSYKVKRDAVLKRYASELQQSR